MKCNRNTMTVMIGMLCFAFALTLVSCIPPQGAGDGMKSLSEMTPKEKATWMMGIYNSQAKDYKEMIKRPNLTNDQKQVLRNKKEVAKKIWPLLNTYRTYVNSGAVPTRQTEDQIIGLINELTGLVLPKLE